MTTHFRIDFVSDVSCPWCAIGLASLEKALASVAPEIAVELHFQPFELNPRMPAEGENALEHLVGKYGITEVQARESGEQIRERGAALGFTFDMERRERVWNTFDAHRLLHWAETESLEQQHALKKALLKAYFTDGLNPSDRELLTRLAGEVGLDASRAREVLETGAYAEETRQQERYYTEAGINSVPAVIINHRHLISGGQPPEVFEGALRQLAEQSVTA